MTAFNHPEMEMTQPDTESIDFTLTSPAESPFPFTVFIKSFQTSKKLAYSFEVNGLDPKTGSTKTRLYKLDDQGHNSYNNFFQKLSFDFGLRLPQNRKAFAKPAFKAEYREVLLENIAPGIRYGYGDPAVIKVQQATGPADVWYYVVATSNDAPDSFPIIRSRNLIDWEFVGYVFCEGNKPDWAADGEFISDYWAPEMHQVGDEFRVYFAARDKNRELCIGLAKSDHPHGPFISEPTPMLKGNVIDPHVFVENENEVFLFWKKDNNEIWPRFLNDFLHANAHLTNKLFLTRSDRVTASFIQAVWPWARLLEPMERFLVQQILIEAVISNFGAFCIRLENLLYNQPDGIRQDIQLVLQFMKTPIFAQKLSADGTRLLDSRVKIMENDREWEAHLVEGVWVTKQHNKYYLFYAGNDFSTDQYGIGLAIADSLLGPYEKVQKPFLRSTEKWWAPGHPSFIMGPMDEPLLFFHAYFPGEAGYKKFRALLSVPLHFKKDGVLLKVDPPIE